MYCWKCGAAVERMVVARRHPPKVRCVRRKACGATFLVVTLMGNTALAEL